MKATTMRRVRQFHHYVGVFFAPAIIFFAFSGALQVIGLHEAKAPGASPPAGWIVWMASVHKDQTPPRARHAHRDDHDAKPAGEQAGRPPAPEASFVPLKIFVLLLSLGLILSAVLGLVVAFSNRATRRISTVVLAAGVVLPLLLLFA